MKDFPEFLHRIAFDECASTNDYIKRNLESLRGRFPLIVWARGQTKGRGRLDHSWLSPVDLGVYATFAFALKPGAPLQYLSLLSGLAVAETLGEMSGCAFTLKWPNDVLFEEKKIAGVLIENIICGEDTVCLAGIGINVGQAAPDFPETIRGQAVSLAMITGFSRQPSDLLAPLAHFYFHWLRILEAGETEKIVSRYRDLSRSFMGRDVVLCQAQGERRGRFGGIADDGALILKTEKGEERLFYEGELKTNR